MTDHGIFMSNIEILDSTSNAVIAKYLDREFPGILLQGDTLKIFFDGLIELKESIDGRDLESSKEIASALKDQLEILLIHYENVLKQHGFRLPYSKRD